MNLKRVTKGNPANPFEAFRQLCYAFGVTELAAKMVIKPGVLYNKADADDETHHQPTLRDVMLATRVTGDYRVLDAMNEAFGRACFDAAKFESVSDSALLELFLDYGKEGGEFCAAMADALKQRTFSAAEFVAVRSEAMDVVAALMTLVARMEGLVDE